jgi:hypothetical protein
MLLAKDDTPYKVEYYLENIERTGYDLVDTLRLSGTTDKTVSAEIRSYEHFEYNADLSYVRGSINGDGSLVLKVYYTRNTYILTIASDNDKAGSIAGGRTAPYGTAPHSGKPAPKKGDGDRKGGKTDTKGGYAPKSGHAAPKGGKVSAPTAKGGARPTAKPAAKGGSTPQKGGKPAPKSGKGRR